MTLDDANLLHEFVVESKEHLADVENQLLKLESIDATVDLPVVNKVFRAVHSIKGAAGFLGLNVLESVAHREEEVLDGMRNQTIKPTKQVINVLLRATDCLKALLDDIETSNERDVLEHIQSLEAILRGEPISESSCDPAKSHPNLPLNSFHSVALDDLNSEAVDSLKGLDVSPEALREFLIESHDNLEQLERDIVSFERDTANEELINSIFRSIHTIKGTAGFLAFGRVEKITHAAENILGNIRAGKLSPSSEISTALFSTIDQVRKLLVSIERTGKEECIDCEELIAKLHHLNSTVILPNSATSTNTCIVGAATATQTKVTSPKVLDSKSEHPLPSTNPSHPVSPSSAAAETHLAATDSTIRVDVSLLDKLMTRVGELVLARNQILQYAGLLGDSALASTSQRLNLITSELQEGVMKTRMQPIGNVWSKFPRLVRDLASLCGKEVRIEMEGKETELDKTIIEAIKDPLTHLVRNTVDHGIEPPEYREEIGKTREGCLYLRAFHEGGQVNIEISDDGAGLNLERIRDKAIEKGLISAEQAARMQEREIGQLIFLPGFSTAEKVSNVSGRGVGMDVVKTNIEKIGGTVDLQTKPGLGTTIKIKIPLTLAIIPALIVTNQGNRFAIPQVNLLELVRLEGEHIQQIEWFQGAPVYRLRGRLLPLVYLREVLQTSGNTKTKSDAINIVVLRADDRQFGLVVDQINDTEEIVVKPLSKQLKNLSVYSGATIMGDGKVALILDVVGIAHAAHVISKMRDRSLGETLSRSNSQSQHLHTLLVLGVGQGRRLALPISQVARLEKIPADSVEHADSQEVVQYRGEIMPLIRLAEFFSLPSDGPDQDGLLNVVVYIENKQSYGLLVDQIHDIVETNLETQRPNDRVGLIASAVIDEHVTDIVDLPKIVQRYLPASTTASL